MTYQPPSTFIGHLFAAQDDDAPDLSTIEGIQEELDRKVADIRNRYAHQLLEPHTLPALKYEVQQVLSWANDVLNSNQLYLIRVYSAMGTKGIDLSLRVLEAKTCELCGGTGQVPSWAGTPMNCGACGGEGKVPLGE
jgi:hypothetical protein